MKRTGNLISANTIRQPTVSQDSTSKDSQTDWEALEAMQDEDIDLSDNPEVMAEQMAQATLRVDGQPISKGKVWTN